MDEKSILLMSEELRAALGEKSRAAIEEEVLSGRWSRKSISEDAAPRVAQEIHVAARVLRCVAIKGGKIRLTFSLLDETPLSRLTSLAEGDVKARIIAGSDQLQVSLLGVVASVRVDRGRQARVSLLIDPAA